MTHAAATTRTLQLPAVGHQGRRHTAAAPAHCHHASPSIAYGNGPTSRKTIMNSSLQLAADPVSSAKADARAAWRHGGEGEPLCTTA